MNGLSKGKKESLWETAITKREEPRGRESENENEPADVGGWPTENVRWRSLNPPNDSPPA